jgi:hypothetical protein
MHISFHFRSLRSSLQFSAMMLLSPTTQTRRKIVSDREHDHFENHDQEPCSLIENHALRELQAASPLQNFAPSLCFTTTADPVQEGGIYHINSYHGIHSIFIKFGIAIHAIPVQTGTVAFCPVSRIMRLARVPGRTCRSCPRQPPRQCSLRSN